MQLTFYLMTFTLKYEHVSAVKGAPDRSSENTPIFEFEIKGAFEVRLLVQKSSQNNLIKGILEEALYVAIEGARKISLSEAQKIEKKCEEKDAFDVAVDGSLDDAIKGASLNLKFGSLSVLYILYSAEQAELLTLSN